MSPKQILLVEDDAASREGLQELLHDEGHRVVAVGTGAEAITAFQQQRPELVVLDYLLPDSNGLEVLHGLREIDTSCPVLVVSAHAVAADDGSLRGVGREARAAGAVQYLQKPLDLNLLLTTIDDVCE